MSENTSESRRHRRYRDPDQPLIYRIRRYEGHEVVLPALVYDESHSGFACVVIGERAREGEAFFHQEHETIVTPIALRHPRQIEPDVHLLGFSREVAGDD